MLDRALISFAEFFGEDPMSSASAAFYAGILVVAVGVALPSALPALALGAGRAYVVAASVASGVIFLSLVAVHGAGWSEAGTSLLYLVLLLVVCAPALVALLGFWGADYAGERLLPATLAILFGAALVYAVAAGVSVGATGEAPDGGARDDFYLSIAVAASWPVLPAIAGTLRPESR